MSRSLLQNVYLFKGLTADEMGAVSELAKTQTYNTGDTIFIKGEPATAMYLIKHGSVKIQQTTKSGDNLVVATLGTGSHFGEMAMVDSEPRSATASAGEMTEVIIIPYDKLKTLLEKNQNVAIKFYRELSHFLCGRLRATTNDLGFAREKNLSHF
jgi:CRP/FNR family transcriptional regulator, cyclic AMP receptor protein